MCRSVSAAQAEDSVSRVDDRAVAADGQLAVGAALEAAFADGAGAGGAGLELAPDLGRQAGDARRRFLGQVVVLLSEKLAQWLTQWFRNLEGMGSILAISYDWH